MCHPSPVPGILRRVQARRQQQQEPLHCEATKMLSCVLKGRRHGVSKGGKAMIMPREWVWLQQRIQVREWRHIKLIRCAEERSQKALKVRMRYWVVTGQHFGALMSCSLGKEVENLNQIRYSWDKSTRPGIPQRAVEMLQNMRVSLPSPSHPRRSVKFWSSTQGKGVLQMLPAE